MRTFFAGYATLLLPSLAATPFVACGGSVSPIHDAPDASGADAGGGDAFAADGSTADAGGGDADAGGAVCYGDDDCPNSVCSFAANITTQPTCPGRCVPYATLGQQCWSLRAACAPDAGIQCNPNTHVCVAEPSPGANQIFADAGEHCSIFGPSCGPGLYCGGPFPDNGICAPIVADGGACPPDDPMSCTAGLVCVGYGMSPDAGRCQPPSALGGTCVLGSDPNGTSGCARGLSCIGGNCEPSPSSGPCAVDRDAPCDFDTSFCDSTTNTCQTFRTNGAPCTGDWQCASKLCDLTQHCGVTLCPRK
jgi:hypothetical protein